MVFCKRSDPWIIKLGTGSIPYKYSYLAAGGQPTVRRIFLFYSFVKEHINEDKK